MIAVQGLSHSYKKGGPFAVKQISFEIAKGEILGFLGPSGAGKSTTQGVLTGLLPLQTGQVRVAGFDMRHPRRELFNRLGVSFEQSNVYAKLSALENLQFYAGLFDVPTEDPMRLLTIVGLEAVVRKRTGEFSKGMKHRLTFARSLVNKPDVWFLDEPTTGLDPAIAHDIKGIIREHNQKGATVFLTTHNMQVADELCHRVAFIVDGEIRSIDSPRSFKLKYGERVVEVEHIEAGVLKRDRLSLTAPTDQQRLGALLEQGTVQTMHTKEATLEEIFIAVTGRGLS